VSAAEKKSSALVERLLRTRRGRLGRQRITSPAFLDDIFN
jgi:hypothetical protein